LSLGLLVILGVLLATLLVYQVFQFIQEWPVIQSKLGESIHNVSESLVSWWGISKETQSQWITKLSEQSGGNILSVIKGAVIRSASSITLLVLIPVYSVLILYSRNYWMNILFRLFRTEKQEKLKAILHHTITTYHEFIKGMSIVYLVVGVLNSIGLLLLGVPHAILFGFIASILTFIPYLGIMIGSLLPITMAWITYDSIWYPVAIVGIFGLVQYLEANVIFPIAVGKRLNVNTLAILVAIFAGEILWGVAGMVLFIPFLGIAKFIADQDPKWKTVALLLGTSEHALTDKDKEKNS
jgi:predicted PurR-regulated permease PerM